MSTKIQDRFSNVKSKHYRWELRRHTKGLCHRCGKKPPVDGKLKCQDCLTYMALKAREYRNNKNLPSLMGQNATRL